MLTAGFIFAALGDFMLFVWFPGVGVVGVMFCCFIGLFGWACCSDLEPCVVWSQVLAQ